VGAEAGNATGEPKKELSEKKKRLLSVCLGCVRTLGRFEDFVDLNSGDSEDRPEDEDLVVAIAQRSSSSSLASSDGSGGGSPKECMLLDVWLELPLRAAWTPVGSARAAQGATAAANRATRN